MTKKKHKVTVFDFISNAAKGSSTSALTSSISLSASNSKFDIGEPELTTQSQQQSLIVNGNDDENIKKKRRSQKRKPLNSSYQANIKPDHFIEMLIPTVQPLILDEKNEILDENPKKLKEKKKSSIKKQILKDRQEIYEKILTNLAQREDELEGKQQNLPEKQKKNNLPQENNQSESNREDNMSQIYNRQPNGMISEVLNEKSSQDLEFTSCPWVITLAGLPYSSSPDFYRSLVKSFPTPPNFWGLYSKLKEEKLKEIIERDERNEVQVLENESELLTKKKETSIKRDEISQESLPSQLQNRQIFLELFYHEKAKCRKIFYFLLENYKHSNYQIKYSNNNSFYYKKDLKINSKTYIKKNNDQFFSYYQSDSLKYFFSESTNSFHILTVLSNEKTDKEFKYKEAEVEYNKYKNKLFEVYKYKDKTEINDFDLEEYEISSDEEPYDLTEEEYDWSLVLNNYLTNEEINSLDPDELQEYLSNLVNLFSSYSTLFPSIKYDENEFIFYLEKKNHLSSLYIDSYLETTNNSLNTLINPSHLSLCFESIISMYNIAFLLQKKSLLFNFKESIILSNNYNQVLLYNFLFPTSISLISPFSLILVNFCNKKSWINLNERNEIKNELKFLIHKNFFIPIKNIKINSFSIQNNNNNKKFLKNISLKIFFTINSHILILKIYDFLRNFLFLNKKYLVLFYFNDMLMFNSFKKNHILLIPINNINQDKFISYYLEEDVLKENNFPLLEKKIFFNIIQNKTIINILKNNFKDVLYDLRGISHLNIEELKLNSLKTSNNFSHQIRIRFKNYSTLLKFKTCLSNNFMKSLPLLSMYISKTKKCLNKERESISIKFNSPNHSKQITFPDFYSNSLKNFISKYITIIQNNKKKINYIYYEFLAPFSLTNKIYLNNKDKLNKFFWIPTVNYLELKEKEKNGIILSDNDLKRKKIINHLVEMLKCIGTYQKKLKDLNSYLYKKKLRYVVGLKQCQQMIKVNRLKVLIIAEDTEDIDVINQSIYNLLELAGHPKPIEGKSIQFDENRGGYIIKKVPCIIALPRRIIGKSLGLSMEKQNFVGIIDPNGAYNHFKPILSYIMEG